MIRFKEEALEKITGCKGDGPLKTSIHKVYPWTQIQDAQREMQDDKNRCAVMICRIEFKSADGDSRSGKIIVEIV